QNFTLASKNSTARSISTPQVSIISQSPYCPFSLPPCSLSCFKRLYFFTSFSLSPVRKCYYFIKIIHHSYSRIQYENFQNGTIVFTITNLFNQHSNIFPFLYPNKPKSFDSLIFFRLYVHKLFIFFI